MPYATAQSGFKRTRIKLQRTDKSENARYSEGSMLKVKELAELEGTAHQNIYRWIQQGKLKAVVIENPYTTRPSYLIRRENYENFKKRRQCSPAAVAEYMNGRGNRTIHPTTIRGWLENGRIKGYKFGGEWIITDTRLLPEELWNTPSPSEEA
jgi:hypothetical protein